MAPHSPSFLRHLCKHLEPIYSRSEIPVEIEQLAHRLLEAMRLGEETSSPGAFRNNWSERDVVLITYGDSIFSGDKKPLQQLHQFLDQHCRDVVNSVHILPFFPYSSDDGFAVIDYLAVSEELGSWEDIENLAGEYRLMADLVINHCSSRSEWFENFIKAEGEGSDYFVTAEPGDDLSLVVRPRTSPLLRETMTKAGVQQVWCTFSHDQVDLNFKNPDVLVAFVKIIRDYLDHGVRLFRLDAVAFLWKQVGTLCINLEQTHEVVRLLRCLIEHAQADAVVITETNIPTRENLSYFGDANEANWVYNFPLPPLLVHCLIAGNSSGLRRWSMAMPPARNGTAYFNFIASHDGIGLRPAEGLLDQEEIDRLVATMESFGGRISWRSTEGGARPYEINISLYDALQGTWDSNGKDEWRLERFRCAHAIMFCLEGIAGLYIHSFLGTGNDYDKLALTGHNRAINRHRWDGVSLEKLLDDSESSNRKVMDGIRSLLQIRIRQPAFHPNATQYTLKLADHFFGVWRQSIDRRQSIFCISNVSSKMQLLPLEEINIIDNQDWFDLLTGKRLTSRISVYELAPYQTVWLSNGDFACPISPEFSPG